MTALLDMTKKELPVPGSAGQQVAVEMSVELGSRACP